MDAKVQQFVDMVRGSDNIVFFGGAGVSTESGIPDFRSVDGLYNQKYQYPPEMILSHTFYEEHTEEFYRFYRDKMLLLTAKPNMAHIKLAELEKAGKVKAVITQNIDGFIRLPVAKMCWNCTGAFIVTIAPDATSFLMLSI
jgi:NAD-dependent deacetylase